MFNIPRKKFIAAKAVGIIAVVILLAVTFSGAGKNGLMLGPFGLYTVITGSMSPTFGAGSVIVTKRAPPGSLQAGDILTSVTADGALVTHRIVDVLCDGADYSYITKGDANNVNDQRPVPHSQTVGRVVFWVNGLGYVLLFIRTRQGLLLVTVCTLLLILLSYFFDTFTKGRLKTGGKIRIGNEVTK